MADEVGFIYLATNEAMPGLVKIGMTTGDVKERIKQLSAETGVPKSFNCSFYREVRNPTQIEKNLHKLFDWCRVNDKREFFETDYRNVKSALLMMDMGNTALLFDMPEVNMPEVDKNSLALIEAVKDEYGVSEVERLLDIGANPNAVNEKGETALTESIWRYLKRDKKRHWVNEEDWLNKVIKREYYWNDPEYNENFTGAGWILSDDDITKKLLWSGAKPNLKGKCGETAILKALNVGKPKLVEVLLYNKADVNLTNTDGNTPLHIYLYTYYSKTPYIKMLLDAGADVNARNKNDATPLHFAAIEDVNVIKFLLDNGANVFAKDKFGNTPLHFVAGESFGGVDEVKVLLDHGAEIDVINSKKETPLYRAAYKNNIGIVKFLLDVGANINLCDGDCRSPLDVAKFLNHDTVVALLTEHKENLKRI